MLAIKKNNPPPFFNLWIKNKKDYNHHLRETILENEQAHLCCYCEKEITAHQDCSHIDHIRPQDKFPQLRDSYSNLVVSCEIKDRCGHAKKNQFNELFIVPTEENPGNYLTYSSNGEIMATDKKGKGNENYPNFESERRIFG